MPARDVYQLLDEQFGGRTEQQENPEIVGTLANNADEIILKQDPRRVAFTLINLGAAAIFVRPMRAAATTAGIQIAAGGSMSVTVRDDFHLAALEWHAISPGGVQAYSLYTVRLLGDGS